MSTTTDRLTKLRNLASHPATPPAEAAAARARIADIEARNPELKESARKKQGSVPMTEEWVREQFERMAREGNEREAKANEWTYGARMKKPHRNDYADFNSYYRAVMAWRKMNPEPGPFDPGDFEDQRNQRRPREQPNPRHYATMDAWAAAMEEWGRENQRTSRPDPFAGWADMPDPAGNSGGFNQTYGQTAAEQAYRRGVRAMKITNATYSKVSQELHECGLDVSPGEWEVIIRQLLQSR